jgi:rhodanese-related sulfurtransferase
MQTINREQLKARLDSAEHPKLVMTLPLAAFNLKHIPGSVRCYTPPEALALLKPDEEIVVYCSCPECPASECTGRWLERHGFSRVLHYAGGVVDWEAAGLPLEGLLVACQ